jgi:hypothetical protein
MSPHLAAALGNAQHRVRLGWPLAVLVIALYAPAGTGLARLVLIAAGLLFLTRQPAPARTTTKPRTVKTAHSAAPAKTSTPTTKAPRQRTADGRWTK